MAAAAAGGSKRLVFRARRGGRIAVSERRLRRRRAEYLCRRWVARLDSPGTGRARAATGTALTRDVGPSLTRAKIILRPPGRARCTRVAGPLEPPTGEGRAHSTRPATAASLAARRSGRRWLDGWRIFLVHPIELRCTSRHARQDAALQSPPSTLLLLLLVLKLTTHPPTPSTDALRPQPTHGSATSLDHFGFKDAKSYKPATERLSLAEAVKLPVGKYRNTKVVCTMGPACWDVDTLGKMMDIGMNVCRLNFRWRAAPARARTPARRLRPT